MKRLGQLIGLQNPSFLIEVRKVRKAQHIYPLSSSWSSGWALQTNLHHFNRISNVTTDIFPTTAKLLLSPDNSLFLRYFCPFEIISETYSRTSTRTGLGQKWLRPKMASLMSRKQCLALFLRNSLPYLFTALLFRDIYWDISNKIIKRLGFAYKT